ncbi:uncharacterized protein LOC111254787 isoform X2 [Varroa destructor]|uniref:lysozyme n=1 Tax=Varroa destructor TaxID=109461 RepID=A0A7M7KTF0_VARDE|nr:uncharacterized protein LOC111254787 isoform X2 [Varroa destructor]
MTQQRGKVTKIVAFVIIPLVILSVIKVDAREFSKCEFAREIRKYFPEEEVAAWTCIAQYESGFKTDAINLSNLDGSSDHGIFQINDRYWCGSRTGTNTCKVECDALRRDDITASIRCAQIVKDKQGFTAWAVWPKCKGQIVSYLGDCDKSAFRSPPSIVFDIQVHPTNRGPGFNRTRTTSSLKSYQFKDIRGPVSDMHFIGIRNLNLTSIGAMGFLGAPYSNSFYASELENYLVNRTMQHRETTNITSALEGPGKIVPLQYRPSLIRFGGMNFLGGTPYYSASLMTPKKAVMYQPSGLTRFGGMNFLGAFFVNTNQVHLQSRNYKGAIQNKNDVIGFSGGISYKPNSFSFSRGFDLINASIQRPKSTLARTSLTVSPRPRLLSSNDHLGPQNNRILAPIEGTLSSSRAGFLGPRLNPLKNKSKALFSLQTTSAPRIRPLQHFAEGSLLRQLPFRATLPNIFVSRQSNDKGIFFAPQKFTVKPSPGNNSDVAGDFVSFQGTGSTIRFGLPGRTKFGILPSSSFRTPPQPMLPRAHPRPITATASAGSPVPVLSPAVGSVFPISSSKFARKTFIKHKPKPSNIQSNLSERSKFVRTNRLLPSTTLPHTQLNGPETSYSSGATFFSIGSPPSPNKLRPAFLPSGAFRPPVVAQGRTALSQKISPFGGLRPLSPQRPNNLLANLNVANSQQLYQAPSLRPAFAQAVLTRPASLLNSPSGYQAEPGFKKPLKGQNPAGRFRFQVQGQSNRLQAPGQMPSLVAIQPTLEFMSRPVDIRHQAMAELASCSRTVL